MAKSKNERAIKTLAENVKKYRTEQNMTMEALANAAGIEYSQVSRIERCLINTSVSVIFALADALSVSAPELLAETDKK